MYTIMADGNLKEKLLQIIVATYDSFIKSPAPNGLATIICGITVPQMYKKSTTAL